MICTCTIGTPLGDMTAAARNDALIGLWFIGQKHYPTETSDWRNEPDLPVFTSLRHELELYFSGKGPAFDIPLDPQGSPFQKTIWSMLLKIPAGKMITYGQLAGSIAQTRGLTVISARAVGGAVARNPISILIPCHRVVGARGALTGYAGGLEKKQALLRIEKAQTGNAIPDRRAHSERYFS